MPSDTTGVMETLRKENRLRVDELKVTLLREWSSGPPAVITNRVTFKKLGLQLYYD